MGHSLVLLELLVLLMLGVWAQEECSHTQFAQTRVDYEGCASKKIREITSWLEREGDGQGQVEKEGIMAVCMAVRKLIHQCGNVLSFCFSDLQVIAYKKYL